MVCGFGYTAFVVDAYAGLIPGWECSLVKDTDFVERALRHAAAYRDPTRPPVRRRDPSFGRRKSDQVQPVDATPQRWRCFRWDDHRAGRQH